MMYFILNYRDTVWSARKLIPFFLNPRHSYQQQSRPNEHGKTLKCWNDCLEKKKLPIL